MTFALMLLAAVAVGTLVALAVARRQFDKLTRQRDGVFFHPFDECSIDRFSGVVTARVWVAREAAPEWGSTYMMSINGIMTEMSVDQVVFDQSSPLVEVDLRDSRSRMARAYGPQ